MLGTTSRGWCAGLACLVALAGCEAERPRVGPPVVTASRGAGVEVVITRAGLSAKGDPHGANLLSLEFLATRDGVPLTADEVQALAPAFTVAGLSVEPVSGLSAWRSYRLTGAQTAAALPPGGPGTPDAEVLRDARQPGYDAGGTLTEPYVGAFVYTFSSPIPEIVDRGETLRVGMFLRGVPGTARTTSTHDFVPAGGTPRSRELVVESSCQSCHAGVRYHAGQLTGTRICVTCHTFQAADPDTVDPAAPLAATAATDPNPLELGRLLHRVHRGKQLPTLYRASSAEASAGPPFAAPPPLPFFPGRNAPVAGRKFSVVGSESRERVFGRIVERTDNQQPARIAAEGVTYVRDYRSCGACHDGAADAAVVHTEIARRSCQGCHPDVWFGDGPPPDAVHLAHTGGPQADDARCAECHVPTDARPVVYAPLAEVHQPPLGSPLQDLPVIEIVAVSDLQPGKSPTITFTVSDRLGPMKSLFAPTPASDAGSRVPRRLSFVAFTAAGPVAPGGAFVPVSGYAFGVDPPSDGQGRFRYTLPGTIPSGATGSWAVTVDATRTSPGPFYDPATDRFSWPYTGETIAETADSQLVWVDTSAGVFPGGNPVPRRAPVSMQKCNACHARLTVHASRTRADGCVLCHNTNATDGLMRLRLGSGTALLSATYDGIEERSLDFKVLIHRIHTGGRSGTASLGAIRPLVVYVRSGLDSAVPKFRDRGAFPNELASCTLCHVDDSFELSAIPANEPPTVANETGTIRDAASKPATPARQAACLGCHATEYARYHAGRNTIGGVEGCLTCHGPKSAYGSAKVHRLAAP